MDSSRKSDVAREVSLVLGAPAKRFIQADAASRRGYIQALHVKWRGPHRGQVMIPTDDQRARAEFDLHVSHLTEMHRAFFDNMGKVTGFLLLALGWFATSKDARAYLASEPTLSTLAAVGVLAAYVLAVAAAAVAFHASRLALERLDELNFLPQSAYIHRALRATTFWVCTLGNGVLATLLVISIVRLKG